MLLTQDLCGHGQGEQQSGSVCVIAEPLWDAGPWEALRHLLPRLCTNEALVTATRPPGDEAAGWRSASSSVRCTDMALLVPVPPPCAAFRCSLPLPLSRRPALSKDRWVSP